MNPRYRTVQSYVPVTTYDTGAPATTPTDDSGHASLLANENRGGRQ
jgi:hypothetical protein